MKVNGRFPYHYICTPCAKKKYLKWPKGHQATQYVDMCRYCGKEDQPITAVSDWLKPGETKLKVWD